MAEPPKLEDLVEFPTTFTFRVVAADAPGLTARCRELVEETLGRPVVHTEEKASKNGNFRSVRISAVVVEAQEIRSAYQALGSVEGLKLLL